MLTRTADLMEDLEFLKSQTTNLHKVHLKLEEQTNETIVKNTTTPSAPPHDDDQQHIRSRSNKKEL